MASHEIFMVQFHFHLFKRQDSKTSLLRDGAAWGQRSERVGFLTITESVSGWQHRCWQNRHKQHLKVLLCKREEKCSHSEVKNVVKTLTVKKNWCCIHTRCNLHGRGVKFQCSVYVQTWSEVLRHNLGHNQSGTQLFFFFYLLIFIRSQISEKATSLPNY